MMIATAHNLHRFTSTSFQAGAGAPSSSKFGRIRIASSGQSGPSGQPSNNCAVMVPT
jgi:hypothetical protein